MAIKRRFFTREGRFIKRKKTWKPFRFVGLGLIIMAAIIYICYKLILK